MSIKRTITTFALLVCLLGMASVSEALFTLPQPNKIGWYNAVDLQGRKWVWLIYRDYSDGHSQILVWQNDQNCPQEVLPGPPELRACQVQRGYGYPGVPYGFEAWMHPNGNTIVPQGSATGYKVDSSNGNVYAYFGGAWLYTLQNHIMSNGLPFFGQSQWDGVYFTLQWGCYDWSGASCPPTMTKLKQNVTPWNSDWDLEIFVITDSDNDSYLVMPAIGPGRTGMEYAWGHIQYESRPLYTGWAAHGNGCCPTWLFTTPNNIGFVGFSGILLDYTNRWWCCVGGPPLTSINGRALRTFNRDPGVISAYQAQGSGFASESQYPW